MKRFFLLILSVATAAVAAAYYIYPQWTMQRVESAINERNAIDLGEMIDWPRVRRGLKADLARQAVLGAKSHNKSDLAIAGAAIGAAMVNPLIDSTVTPQGLFDHPEVLAVGRRLSNILVDQRFTTHVTYVMDFKPSEAPGFSLVMELRGLKWRITRFVPSSQLWEALGNRMLGPDSEAEILERLLRQ